MPRMQVATTGKFSMLFQGNHEEGHEEERAARAELGESIGRRGVSSPIRRYRRSSMTIPTVGNFVMTQRQFQFQGNHEDLGADSGASSDGVDQLVSSSSLAVMKHLEHSMLGEAKFSEHERKAIEKLIEETVTKLCPASRPKASEGKASSSPKEYSRQLSSKKSKIKSARRSSKNYSRKPQKQKKIRDSGAHKRREVAAKSAPPSLGL